MLDAEKVAEFIAAAGMFIVTIDEVVAPTEQKALLNALSNYVAQPEKYLYFTTVEEHIKRTERICAYFANADDYTKGTLLGTILGLAMCDGLLPEEEKELFRKLASLLNVSREDASLLLVIFQN